MNWNVFLPISNLPKSIQKEDAREPSLEGTLSEVALVADIDSMDDDAGRVILMTLHSAKGLEFPQGHPDRYGRWAFSKLYVGGFGGSGCSGRGAETLLCRHHKSDAGSYSDTCEKAYDARRNTLQPSVQVSKRTSGRAVEKEKREEPKEQEPKPRVQTSFMQAKSIFQTKAYDSVFDLKKGMPAKAGSLDYAVGDTVRHIKFGVGIVEKIEDGGRDYEVTVNFEKCGVKKMFAAFAKLKKL